MRHREDVGARKGDGRFDPRERTSIAARGRVAEYDRCRRKGDTAFDCHIQVRKRRKTHKMVRFSCSFAILACLNLIPVDAFSQTAASDAVAERVDRFLMQAVDNGFAGAVLVARGDEITLSKGYGVADRDRDIAVTPATVFNIGSVTKPFTAAAIMKLVEQGRLRTSDTLGSLFENVPQDKRNITVHQLLTHTAGVSRNTGGFRYDRATRSEFLELFFRTPLAREPGGPYEYANAGYTVLAAIIETVSGQSYEAFLRENLFEPAGMSQTGYLLPAWQRENFAHSYYFDVERNGWADWGITLDRFGEDGVSWFGIGKGDLQSTVLDLYAWHLALERERYFREKRST